MSTSVSSLTSSSASPDLEREASVPFLGPRPPANLQPEQEVHPVLTFSRQRAPYFMLALLVGVLVLVYFTTRNYDGAHPHPAPNPSPHPSSSPIACPNSTTTLLLLPRSKCAVDLQITDFMCEDVQEEVERRLLMKDDWVDPRAHLGTYALIESVRLPPKSRTTLVGRTLKKQHTAWWWWQNGGGERILFTFLDVPNVGCRVRTCSQSQSLSLSVTHTQQANFCNIHNLLCGKAEGCQVCRHDMRPANVSSTDHGHHEWGQCSRHNKALCGNSTTLVV